MKIINLGNLSGTGAFSWDHDYLVKFLSTGKNAVLHNPKLIAAFKEIDRKDFVPMDLKDQAYLDQELDIGYNEELTRPSTLAQMAELLEPKPGGKYLDLGSGTGYFAAILAFVAGVNGKVIGMERVQWLWELSNQNISKYESLKGIVKFVYKDGIEGIPEQAPFDGMHVSFAMNEVPEGLKNQLDMKEGKLVMPTTNHDVRVITRHGMNEFEEEIVPGFVFREGQEGTV